MGHPRLQAKAKPCPADIKSAVVQKLIDDMLDTMHEYHGVGLAGPQVHEGLRIFVAGLRDAGRPITELSPDAEMPYIVMINPQLTMVGDTVEEAWEGCLSIPDIRGRVPRAYEIKVDALDRKGHRQQFTARGLPARVIQHETDHLDGVLFFDRMRSLESLAFMDEYQRYWVKHEDDE